MPVHPSVLDAVLDLDPQNAWNRILAAVMEIVSPAIEGSVMSGIKSRDRATGLIDTFISTSAWELWPHMADKIGRNTIRLKQWWEATSRTTSGGKAVLILDGLSLRELPMVVQGATERGFTILNTGATVAEYPGITDAFARALGYGTRSRLQNNCASTTGSLTGAKTESVNLPWQDCAGLVDSSPSWLFWHHWPDAKAHECAEQGQGLDTLVEDCAATFANDAFWDFVKRLSRGRRLVITSDHGYAATGIFPDANQEASGFLKNTFRGGRYTEGEGECGTFVPPVAMRVRSDSAAYRMAVGRWKWRNQAGYPTLAHGGFSLLETLCPWVELSI